MTSCLALSSSSSLAYAAATRTLPAMFSQGAPRPPFDEEALFVGHHFVALVLESGALSASECERLLGRLPHWWWRRSDVWTNEAVQHELLLMHEEDTVAAESAPDLPQPVSVEELVTTWPAHIARVWAALETARQRIAQPDRFPRTEFAAAAQLDQQTYDRHVAERNMWWRLPAFSQTLSSVHRPPQPPAAATDMLSLLDVHSRHLVLSFVPSTEFFLRFPRLSRATRYMFTHPHLHQQYGQSRMELTHRQWALFGSHCWHALTRPVWKEPYYLHEERVEQIRQADECGTDDWANCLKTSYPHPAATPHPDHSQMLQPPPPPPPAASSPPPPPPPPSSPPSHQPTAPSEAATTPTTASTAAHTVSAATAVAPYEAGTPPATKDWCMESVHVHLLVVFATLFLMRRAPNVTSAGRPIRYTLPAVLRALIIDRITAQEVFGIVSDNTARRTYAACWDVKHRLMLQDTLMNLELVTSFSPRVSAEHEVTLPDIAYPHTVRPSTAIESAAVAAQRAVIAEQQFSERPGLERLVLSDQYAGLDEMVDITDSMQFEDREDCTQAYGLWYGEQLRRAIDGDGDGDGVSVMVDLEHCPIVRLTCGEAESGDLKARFEVVALSASEWLECGGARTEGGGAMWREDADRLALWLGVKEQLTEEEQQRVRAGDEWRNRWHQLQHDSSGDSSSTKRSMDAIEAAATEAAADRVFDIRYPHIPRYRYQRPPMYWRADLDIDQAARQLHVECADRWKEYQQRLMYRLMHTQPDDEQGEQEVKRRRRGNHQSDCTDDSGTAQEAKK